jgi:hypothetical protein
MRWNRPKKRTIKGLGDIVELIAEPIADLMDKHLNTKIKGCNSCKERKEFLNELVSFDNRDK